MNEDYQRGAVLGARLPECGESPSAAMSAQNSCGRDRTPPLIETVLEVRADCDFSAALNAAIHGHRVTRAGWNARGQWVCGQHPDKGSKMSSPYLYLKNAQNEFVPWVPSQGDLFARDWAILPIQPI